MTTKQKVTHKKKKKKKKKQAQIFAETTAGAVN